jgi:hypothetical protein|tara:strand:+ start:11736 stop:12017 length:282 start_codon:yes stop_codon:yes gene_type:complete
MPYKQKTKKLTPEQRTEKIAVRQEKMMTQYSRIAYEEFGTKDLNILASWQMDKVTSKAMNWDSVTGRKTKTGRKNNSVKTGGGLHRGSAWYSN